MFIGNDNERIGPSHVQGRCDRVLPAANEFALLDWDVPAGIKERP